MTRTESRPARSDARSRVASIVLAGLAMLCAAQGVATTLLRDPPHVRALTVDNRTSYDVHVDVGGFDSGGVVGLGTVAQHCQMTFHEVLDPGPTWTLHLRAQSERGGTITVSRSQLERDGALVVIPRDVGSRLAAAGAPPPPVKGCSSQ